MSRGARSSTCTASTHTLLPKMLATRRNLDSQTYSAFIEEAEILESFVDMEPPIRYSLRAPSKRYYCVIALCQLGLLSTVVALVLLVANNDTSLYKNNSVGYIVWLVFSACATVVFALLAFVFWHQRHRMRDMQTKLKTMQHNAEAQGSQKRLETQSSAPQLRTETDHRQSMLTHHQHFGPSDVTADTIRRNSSIVNNSGRRRQHSSAAGEGCELTLFQTHLSGGSAKGDADNNSTINIIQSPPLSRNSSGPHHHQLPQLQRESTTARLFQDDPTMLDLFHGLQHSPPPPGRRESITLAPSPSSPSSPGRGQRPSSIIVETTRRSPPSPTSRTLAATACRRPRQPSLRMSSANRSSTALPGIFGGGNDDDDNSPLPSPLHLPPHHSTTTTTTTTTTRMSSSLDYGTVLLPSFPLPPTHARFSELPQEGALHPLQRLSRRNLSRGMEGMLGGGGAAEEEEGEKGERPEEREVWSRIAGLSSCCSNGGQSQNDDESSTAGAAAVVSNDQQEDEGPGARDDDVLREEGVFREQLGEEPLSSTSSSSGNRRDSHVDGDGQGDSTEHELSPLPLPPRSKAHAANTAATADPREVRRQRSWTDVSSSVSRFWHVRRASEPKSTRRDGGDVGAVPPPSSKRSSRGLASLRSSGGEGYARLDDNDNEGERRTGK